MRKETDKSHDRKGDKQRQGTEAPKGNQIGTITSVQYFVLVHILKSNRQLQQPGPKGNFTEVFALPLPFPNKLAHVSAFKRTASPVQPLSSASQALDNRQNSAL